MTDAEKQRAREKLMADKLRLEAELEIVKKKLRNLVLLK